MGEFLEDFELEIGSCKVDLNGRVSVNIVPEKY